MTILVIGLLIFLGIHSVRLFNESRRTALVKKLGDAGYKGFYSVLSLVGLILIVIGYGQTRTNPTDIWYPDGSLRGIAILMVLVAFILLAANEPTREKNSHIKHWLKHPMTIGIIIWATAHLMVNGRLGDIVLFGAFLFWAVLCLLSGLRRDRINKANGLEPVPVQGWRRDISAVIGGIVVWAVFAFVLHPWLIGVRVA
jgi:uncharacterized membrane protein